MVMLNLKIIDVSEVSVSQCHLSGLCYTWVGSWWLYLSHGCSLDCTMGVMDFLMWITISKSRALYKGLKSQSPPEESG